MIRSLRRKVAPFAKTALMKTGGYAVLRLAMPSRKVAILRYHAICGEEGYRYASPGICISPEAFEQHVAYLAANYAVLPMPEAVARLRDSRPLPKNAVVITFDDGYADNLAAARVLHRHGVSATFFITAGCLAGGQPFWPAEIRGLVAAIRATEIRLPDRDGAIVLPLLTEAERDQAVNRLTKLFKSRTIPAREAFRDALRELAAHPRLAECMLTWDQLAEMHRLGMTIGAHTMTHPNLPSAGLPEATREIVQSKTRLEQAVREPVTLMSYPNGGADRYYTPDLQRAVADAGFAACASSFNAFAGPESDLYALERIEVEERLEDLVFALEVERVAFRPKGETRT